MRWLAVHLPCLSLEAYCAALPPADTAQPVVLIAEHRVHAVNTDAAERGIRPGMKRATALALAAGLRLGEADAGRNTAAASWRTAPRARLQPSGPWPTWFLHGRSG